MTDYLFVGDRDDVEQVLTLDVSDKQNPAVADTYSSINHPNKVARFGDYIIVTEQQDGRLVVFDISDPTNLTEAGRTDSLLGNGHYGVAIGPDENYAYSAIREGEVGVTDISDPTNPVIVGVAQDSTILNGATWVDVSGGYVYAACGGYNGGNADTANNRVVSVDVSDKSNPQIVDDIQADELKRADSIRVYEDHAYVGVWDEGYFTAVNISDPTNLQITDWLQSSAYNRIFQIAIRETDELAFCSAEGVEGVVVFDISDPADIKEAARLTLENGAGMHGVAVDSTYAYAIAAADQTATIIEWS